MRPDGEGFTVIDLLGRELTGVLDWLTAEETLDATGIGYLADPFELRLADGHWLRVRLTEISVDSIRAKKEDWGDMTASQVYYTVPFPPGDELRVLAR